MSVLILNVGRRDDQAFNLRRLFLRVDSVYDACASARLFGFGRAKVAFEVFSMKIARVILFTGQMDAMSRFYGEVLRLKRVSSSVVRSTTST